MLFYSSQTATKADLDLHHVCERKQMSDYSFHKVTNVIKGDVNFSVTLKAKIH